MKRRRVDREQTANRWAEVKKNVARSIEEFDNDVIFIKEVNDDIVFQKEVAGKPRNGTTTPSPPGFRAYRPHRPGKPKPRYPKPVTPRLPKPLKPKAPVKKPEKATLGDFMPPTPPGSESEDWDRDIAREADVREALAAARGDI